MPYRGFESDACYFDLIAQSAHPKDQKQLRRVAATYRSLAKNGGPRSGSRQQNWSSRAAQSRALAEQFKHPACRMQLLRLADTYDLLAEASDGSDGRRA